MTKYLATALALKFFSLGPLTRGVYRSLGNRLGGKRRSHGPMPPHYIDRIQRILRLCEEYPLVKDGDRILEVGTGWLHWEAITLRLFYDIESVLYDVWDNRQMGGLKNYLTQLRPLLETELVLSQSRLKRARSIIDKVLSLDSFEEIYEFLNFTYVVEPSGSLGQFKDGTFQLVVSAGVLEHVDRDSVPILISETNRVLQNGGWAAHSIDTSDHLAHYDRSVNQKLYLKYPEKTWKRYFENGVQRINRIQAGEWIDIFENSHFEIFENYRRPLDISEMELADRYRGMSKNDIACTILRVTMAKR